jgi:hypothetical protein
MNAESASTAVTRSQPSTERNGSLPAPSCAGPFPRFGPLSVLIPELSTQLLRACRRVHRALRLGGAAHPQGPQPVFSVNKRQRNGEVCRGLLSKDCFALGPPWVDQSRRLALIGNAKIVILRRQRSETTVKHDYSGMQIHDSNLNTRACLPTFPKFERLTNRCICSPRPLTSGRKM